jgi:hypothetical protein
MTVPVARTHTAAIVAVLEAAGLTVGNGSGIGLTAPYVVVYSDSGAVDGPLGDRFADLDQTVILHSVGTGPEQAQWVADKARTALLGSTPTVTGRTVLYVDHADSQPLYRDDDVTPPLYLAVDTYTFSTTPA